MKQFTSMHETELANIQGGDGAYAREYGQFLGGVVGADLKYGWLTSMPGIGGFIAVGFGLWAAASQ